MTDKQKKNPWKNLRTGVSARRKARFSRQHESAEEDRRSRSRQGGSRRGGFWKNEIKIKGERVNKKTGVTEPAEPVVVRLVPGEYPVPDHVAVEFEEFLAGDVLPNFLRVEYKHKSVGAFGVFVPDTRDTADGKDLSLYLMDQGDDTIQPKLINYYNVIDLGTWHKIPTTETYKDKKTGETRTGQGFEWVRCQGKGCPMCEQGHEKIVGRPGYYRLTSAFEAALNSIAGNVGQFCSCGCPAPLTALSANCSSCGHVFAEAEFDEGTGEIIDPISPRKIGQLYDKHHTCPSCGSHLVEVPEADDEATIIEELSCDGCTEPQRASIYDADLALIKEGTGPKTVLRLDNTKFQARGFRVRQVPEAILDRAQVYDFAEKLPHSLAYVAKRIQLPANENPYYEAPEGREER